MAEHKGKRTDKAARRGKAARDIRLPPGEAVQEIHPAGRGGPSQQAGGPDHHGGDEHEDRNP